MKIVIAVLSIFFACLIAACHDANAQNEELFFKRIGSAEGLKDITISSIVEDKAGFIWFTSFSGISKFNGYEIIHFYFSKSDSNSIPSNRVNICYTDNKGTVWFGTEFGFCNYNEKENNFNRYRIANAYKNSKNNVHAFAQINDSDLVIGTADGIFLFNLKSHTLYKPKNILGHSNLQHAYINKLHFENSQLLISTRKGIFASDLKRNILLSFSSKENGEYFIASDNIYASAFYENKLWMLSRDAIIYCADLDSHTIKTYTDLIDKNKGWNENQGLHCIYDNNGNLWFGTLLSGLVRYNPHTDAFEYWQKQVDNEHSISDNHVRFIFPASNGILWIGTTVGISYVNPLKNYFTVLKTGSSEKPKLLANWTRAFAADSMDRIWIATVEGVSVYNPKLKSFTNYQNKTDGNNLLCSNSIRSLCADENKYMWIGTANGLTRFNFSSGNFKSYQFDKNDSTTINGNFIVALLRTKKGKLYIGNNNGFCRYNRELDRFERLHTFSNTAFKFKFSARSIVEDNNGNIWISPLKTCGCDKRCTKRCDAGWGDSQFL